jgi:YbbR domain-containing protein
MNGNRITSYSLAMLALLIAAGTWVIASAQRRERTIERAFDVPIALVGVPRDLIVTTAVQDTVSVRLRGAQSILRGVTTQALEATVDLSDSRAGSIEVLIRPHALNVPDAVEVVSISPERFRLTLEARRQKNVRIRPYFVGQPPLGFEVREPTITPPVALISGPASLLGDITEVATERIILTGRTTDFRVRVALVSDSALVRIIDPLDIVVDVPIRPEAELDEVAGVETPEPEGTTSPQ